MTDDIKNELLKLSMFSNIPKKYRILCAGGFSLIDNLQNENKELKNQQKEFIEWLENWLKILKEQFKGMRGVNAAYQRLIIDTVNETLSKYKEIIGDK